MLLTQNGINDDYLSTEELDDGTLRVSRPARRGEVAGRWATAALTITWAATSLRNRASSLRRSRKTAPQRVKPFLRSLATGETFAEGFVSDS